MIRAVLFDVGGVLLTLGEAAYRQGMAARMGLERIPDTYDTYIPKLQRGELAEEEVWEEVFGRPVSSDAFDDIWLAHFRPIPLMLNLAERVRGHGLATGLLSNTQPSHVRIMRGMAFVELFDPVLFSCEVGHRKPERRLFETAVRRLGLDPSEVVFIDDVEAFSQAAKDAGLHAVHHRGDVEETRGKLERLLERPL